MRIEGPKQTSETSSKKAAGKADSSGAFGALIDTSATKPQSETRAPALVSDISSLIALQAVDDVQERQKRKRMRARGEALLKQLDAIKLGLTMGGVTLQQLQELDILLEQSREQIEDPRLQEILDEIELRAAIECAKLEMAAELTRDPQGNDI